MLTESDLTRIEAHWSGPNRIANAPELDRCLEDLDVLLAEVKRLRVGIIQGTGSWNGEMLVDMDEWALELLGMERMAYVREIPKGDNR